MTTLFEVDLQAKYLRAVERYQKRRRQHRPRKRQKRAMQKALHRLLIEELR